MLDHPSTFPFHKFLRHLRFVNEQIKNGQAQKSVSLMIGVTRGICTTITTQSDSCAQYPESCSPLFWSPTFYSAVQDVPTPVRVKLNRSVLTMILCFAQAPWGGYNQQYSYDGKRSLSVWCGFMFIVLFAPIFLQSTEPTGNFKTWNKCYYFVIMVRIQKYNSQDTSL